jgi:hypothetical protein
MKKIDYDYFEWLTSQITIPNNNSYGELFSRMHNFEFVWLVPNDDNREKDGLSLRAEFLNGRHPNSLILEGVSILEVLVALSRRVAFIGGGDAEMWAWRLLKNLRLNKASDPITEAKAARIDETLYALVWRTYQPNGRGGFFPLKFPKEDQTKIEIWFQMNAYIIEMEGL